MLLFGLTGPAGLAGDFGYCTSTGPGAMSIGDTCTLPDGSNIALWNGSQLVNPASGPIDGANASALVAGGWSPSQISGAVGGGTSQGSGTPGWATTATSAGAAALAREAASFFRPTGGGGGMPSVGPRPTPWYATPIGIGGIAIGIVALVMLLRR